MSHKTTDSEQLHRYLVGDVSDAEAVAIEQRYFDDPDYFELLEAVADELVAADAKGELDPRQRESIAALANSAYWRRRQTFLGALGTVVADEAVDGAAQRATKPGLVAEPASAPLGALWRYVTAHRRPILAAGAFAGALALMLLAGGNIVKLQRAVQALQSELRVEREQTQKTQTALVQELATLRSDSDGLRARLRDINTIALAVLPGALRGPGPGGNAFRLSPEAEFVRLELALDADLEPGATHMVQIWRDSGAVDVTAGPSLWSEVVPAAATGGGSINVVVPLSVVSRGRYYVVLAARRGPQLEPILDYHFSVSAP